MTTSPSPFPRRRPGAPLLLAACAALLAATPAPAHAQFGGGDDGFRRPGGVRALIVGARGGFDFEGDAPVLGAFVRTSVWGRFALQGSADLTFLDGLTERQFGGDLLVSLGPGLNVGGGPVWRYTAYDVTPSDLGVQETRTGYSLVAVLGGGSGPGRVVTALEFRWSKVDDLDTQALSLQIGIPLARW